MNIPTIQWDWALFNADRHGFWAGLRETGPVVNLDGYGLFPTRRADVLAALRDPHVFSSCRVPFTTLPGDRLHMVPISYQPPQHTRYRKILAPLFTPRALDGLKPELTALAQAVINTVAGAGECDAMSALATPFACDALLALCGLPLADRDTVIAVSGAYCGRDGYTDKQPEGALIGYLSDTIAALVRNRDRRPLRGMLSQLIRALAPSELVSFYAVLMLGAVESVAAAAGYALCELARNRPLCTDLRARPDQVALFVDEMLRLEPPILFVDRVTTRQASVAGVDIPAGTGLTLCVGAISHEDSDNNGALRGGQLHRHRHWAFGAGIHNCVGQQLARMELAIFVAEWLRRIPDFELVAAPRIVQTIGANRYDRLPLRW